MRQKRGKRHKSDARMGFLPFPPPLCSWRERAWAIKLLNYKSFQIEWPPFLPKLKGKRLEGIRRRNDSWNKSFATRKRFQSCEWVFLSETSKIFQTFPMRDSMDLRRSRISGLAATFQLFHATMNSQLWTVKCSLKIVKLPQNLLPRRPSFALLLSPEYSTKIFCSPKSFLASQSRNIKLFCCRFSKNPFRLSDSEKSFSLLKHLFLGSFQMSYFGIYRNWMLLLTWSRTLPR